MLDGGAQGILDHLRWRPCEALILTPPNLSEDGTPQRVAIWGGTGHFGYELFEVTGLGRGTLQRSAVIRRYFCSVHRATSVLFAVKHHQR